MRTHLLKEVFVSHIGLADEDLKTFDIPIPPKTVIVAYSNMVASAGLPPTTNKLEKINSLNVAGKNWFEQIIITLFSVVGVNVAQSNFSVVGTSSFYRYSVRSAGTDCNFFLLIKFFDRI